MPMSYDTAERSDYGARRTFMLIAVEGLDGSGKSTLVRSLADALAERRSVLMARPARQSIQILRDLTGDDGNGPTLYQEHSPPDFRHAAYILETAVQFRYLADHYSAHDIVIFDRWTQTWCVYCSSHGVPSVATAVVRRHSRARRPVLCARRSADRSRATDCPRRPLGGSTRQVNSPPS